VKQEKTGGDRHRKTKAKVPGSVSGTFTVLYGSFLNDCCYSTISYEIGFAFLK
jgi:hypothetical protein